MRYGLSPLHPLDDLKAYQVVGKELTQPTRQIIDDAIYEAVVGIQGDVEENQETPGLSSAEHWVTRTYFLHAKLDHRPIQLQESTLMISEGTTGLQCWKAAQALAIYLLDEQSALFADAAVLELGAGTGLCSIALAKYGQIRSATVTDHNPRALALCARNVQANLKDASRLHTQLLDFSDPQEVGGTHDVIIAADIVSAPPLP